MKPLKIVVAAGGTSTERDVSLVTGRGIYRALKELGHKVILIDVFYGYHGADASEASRLFEAERDWAEDIKEITEQDPDLEDIRAQRPDPSDVYFGKNVLELCRLADIVFLALHGGDGENGRVQATFDLFGIKYTGTGYLASALAMDKYYSKLVFESRGISSPDFSLVKVTDFTPVRNFPCVVKTRSGGSSVGVYIAGNEEEYRESLRHAAAYGDEVLVEDYISGREYSVGVVDGKALPVVEISTSEGFYDYKHKYQDGGAVHTCPAPLSDDKTKEIQDMAEAVYHALEIEAYARMDFMIREDGKIFCLEANTLPGMTPTSLVPHEAEVLGISYGELCEQIIEVSMKKYDGGK
ncbi:MAG: D-alanine--D-alanine ligase [Lachnospiraceae bacterium]|nr:D-alanine--D-alanine ligase [Lachnospiraceae bacterium]